MLRSITFLFILTFVTFNLGCTETINNYYQGECDEHSDDDGNDGPIEETGDDDDSASGDDDDDDDGADTDELFVEVSFTTAYHAAAPFEVTDPEGNEVTLGTFVFQNDEEVDIDIDEFHPLMLVRDQYEEGAGFYGGSDGDIRADEFFDSCVLRGWPELIVIGGPTGVQENGEIEFIDRFTLFAGENRALDMVCTFVDELPEFEDTVAFAVDLTVPESVQAEDEDGYEVTVEITDTNGNPPQVCAYVEPIVTLLWVMNNEEESFSVRSVTGGELFHLYIQTTEEDLVLDSLELDIRGDSDADLDNGVDDAVDIQERFTSFDMIFGGSVVSAYADGAGRIEFHNLGFDLEANSSYVIELYGNLTSEVMGNQFFAAVLEEKGDLGLFDTDGNSVNDNSVVLIDFVDGDVDQELNSNFLEHLSVANTRLTVSLAAGSPSGVIEPQINNVLRINLSADEAGDVLVTQIPFWVVTSDDNQRDWNICDVLADELMFSIYDLDDPSTEIELSWDFRNYLLSPCSMNMNMLFGYAMVELDLWVVAGSTKTVELRMDTSDASEAADDSVRVDVNTHHEFLFQDEFGESYNGWDAFGIPITGGTLVH
jgi:hypothetical protein